MFLSKYNTTLLDSKWNIIQNNIKFNVVPRKNEYIYHVDRYYNVVNVVHDITNKHKIFIVIEEVTYDKNNDFGSTKKII